MPTCGAVGSIEPENNYLSNVHQKKILNQFQDFEPKLIPNDICFDAAVTLRRNILIVTPIVHCTKDNFKTELLHNNIAWLRLQSTLYAKTQGPISISVFPYCLMNFNDTNKES